MISRIIEIEYYLKIANINIINIIWRKHKIMSNLSNYQHYTFS